MLKKQLDDANTKFQQLSDVTKLNADLAKAKLDAVKPLSKDDWNKKQK